jgi:hypothetical protein
MLVKTTQAAPSARGSLSIGTKPGLGKSERGHRRAFMKHIAALASVSKNRQGGQRSLIKPKVVVSCDCYQRMLFFALNTEIQPVLPPAGI